MTYNFTDDPTPSMPSEVDSSGALTLTDGTPQGDYLTTNFSGSTVTVSIVPPLGYTLDTVTWPNGGNGTFNVPAPGGEDTYAFSYAVSNGDTRLTDNGQFKIKKQTNG